MHYIIDHFHRHHLLSIQISEQNVLTSLHADKATGIDGIGPRILKQCALILIKPLHHLQFHMNGVFIQLFLCTNPVTRLQYHYLAQHPKYWRNYIVYSKIIIPYISSFFSTQQFGFLKNRSTVQQLLLMFNTIFSTDNQTDVVYLDFRKVFDSVPHNELLLKLHTIGISSRLWLWST